MEKSSRKETIRRLRKKYQAYLLRSLFNFLKKRSFNAIYRFSYWISILFTIFPNKNKNIAITNINTCYPNLSPKEREALLKKVLFHNVASILEFPKIWNDDPSQIFKYLSVPDEEPKKEILFPKGGIMITPHLGAWELTGLYTCFHYQLSFVYRPSRLGVDQLVLDSRQRLGSTGIPANQNGVRTMIKALKNGEVLGILPDQDPKSGEGRFAPFFGIDTNTMTLVSRLAQRYHLPIYLITIVRENLTLENKFKLTDAFTFKLNYLKLEEDIYHSNIDHSVAYLNKILENEISKYPEQYLWCYPRFKTRPENENKGNFYGQS